MKLITFLSVAALVAATVRAETPGAGAPGGKSAATSPAAPAGDAGTADGKAGAKAPEAPTPEETERYRAVMQRLDAATEAQAMVSAMHALRAAFPKSRDVLQEYATTGSVKTRSFAVTALGEMGNSEKDLQVVLTGGLSHPDARVRLPAILAVRRLGKDGLPAMLKLLPVEDNVNNRKMAIKTLQHWSDPKALPALIKLLRKEEDKGVRSFAVKALQVISGQEIADDVEAWEEYLETVRIQEQARELMSATRAGGEEQR